MIVSHSRSFIFVAVPKTGTQSVRQALQCGLTTADWEQCSLLSRKAFPVPDLAAIGHGHITCRQLHPFLPEQIWQNYFKFAFVRNPFERLKSVARFWQRDGTPISVEGCKRLLTRTECFRHVLMRPQTEFLCDEEGRVMVDTVGRYDNLEADFTAICERIGMPTTSLPRLNVSPHSPRLNFDAELKEMVLDFYRSDFSCFGFSQMEPANCP